MMSRTWCECVALLWPCRTRSSLVVSIRSLIVDDWFRATRLGSAPKEKFQNQTNGKIITLTLTVLLR